MRVGRLALLVVSVLVTLLATAGPVSASTTMPGAESDFVARIAGERSSRGLGALQTKADLVVVARRHAERMADRGQEYHNPALGDEVQGWQVVGENVGRGPDVESLHEAFMASQTHKDQILYPGYTELGVGVVKSKSDGALYVVQIFRQPMAASEPAPAPAPTPAPAPAPAPVPEPAPAPPPPAASPAPAPAAPVAGEPATDEATPATEVALPPVNTETGGPGAAGTGLSTVLSAMATFDLSPAGEADIARAVLETAPEVPPAVGVATGLLALVIGLQGVAVRRLGLA